MNTDLIYSFIQILIIVVILVSCYALFWWGLFIPIRKKQALDRELDDKRKELEQIQIQKGVEWESYKDLQNQFEAMRKEYFANKNKLEEIKEENAKLEADKIKLKDTLAALKKEKDKTK
ncbi:hypothetical protein [Acholeplasma hippikon]|uniref:Uncharacterized protein n=1 Tax=Acholeplasma hippikon TaxID=264636 RepID=A0A449BLN8_9MOLU|nr:hypothetical protein [Acholeplasma hippikon]VEU83148.1 Uncharacterised protein [Acholeplasma hippikon]VEU83355.1 Uncharacterised protein [Acholeplasma hippikon]